MKQRIMRILAFFKINYFILFAIVAFMLPDFQLRNLIPQDALSGIYAGPVSWGFSIGWILLLLSVFLLLCSKKIGRILYVVTNGLFIVLSLCQYIYFKIFGQFFRIKSIGLAGEGAAYLGYAFNYVDLFLIICTTLAVICLCISAAKWNKPKIKSRKVYSIVLVPILLISILHLFMQPFVHGNISDNWDSWRQPPVVYSQFNDINKGLKINGLYHLTIRDTFKTLFVSDNYNKEEFKEVDEYFASKPAPSENEYTGLLKGKNVVAVMLEGLDTWMLDKEYTPTMCYMMENGINFTNYYAPTFGTGHTFNSEFAFNTGFYTPRSAASAVSFTTNSYPYSMPQLFKNAGYTVNSFHFNDSEFYNRGIMHKRFGYEKYNSFADFGTPQAKGQADSNILKNQAIYEKMFSSTPFFNFIITYSPHVPYTYDDEKMMIAKANHPELIDKNIDPEKNNCMILAADTDDFFRQLLEGLERDKLLEDTVIIAYTDHYAYGFSDQKKLAEYKKGDIIYRVPAFIFNPGIKNKKVEKPMMTADWLPTVLNLFDLSKSGGYIGNDIFDPKNTGFVYFGSSDWIDADGYYNPTHNPILNKTVSRIQKQNARVKKAFRINDIVISGDYYANR